MEAMGGFGAVVKSFLFLELRQNSKLQKRANRLKTVKGPISLVMLSL